MRCRPLVAAPLLVLLTGCGDPGPDTGGETGATSDSGTDGGEAGGSGSADSGDGDGDGDGDGTVPFAVDAHTALVDGRLRFEINVPPRPEDCAALPHPEPPCADEDLDDVVDVWEELALQRLRPIQRMDEAEQLFSDADAVVGDVGRVTWGDDGNLRVYVMLGYSRDYGSCGFTAHNGDSERVVMSFAPLAAASAGAAELVAAYTAAHEGTVSDGGRVYLGPELDALAFAPDPWTAEPRWVVYPSADKHATYATIAQCESVSVVPCFDEDCAPDGVADPGAYDLLPDVVNAGEEAAPFVTELSVVGFPGEQAWADVEFCGGLGGSGCSSPVREKLLVDPFAP